MGVPKNGWFRKTPMKWMRTGGTGSRSEDLEILNMDYLMVDNG